jgi:hypothetical protein
MLFPNSDPYLNFISYSLDFNSPAILSQLPKWTTHSSVQQKSKNITYRLKPRSLAKKAKEKRRYRSYSFSTSVLDGCQLLASRPSRALAPGKGPPVPTVQEAGWAPESVRTQRPKEKSFRLCRGSNLYRPVVQPVARLYTAWATWLTLLTWLLRLNSVSNQYVLRPLPTCLGVPL